MAVVVVRDGRLPVGAVEAVAEAHGRVVVVGTGADAAARSLPGVTYARWSETAPGFQPGALAASLALVVESETLVVLPASPDGRDLAPRLAACMGRPLVARVMDAIVGQTEGGTLGVRASLARVDDRLVVPVAVQGPAVVTLATGGRATHVEGAGSPDAVIEELNLAESPDTAAGSPDPELVELLEPDPHTMDLAHAIRVMAGGAGLVTGRDDHQATAVFTLLTKVAGALGGSAGATRVATDAGWTGYERQIGTTGVTVDPDLYVAFGVSGAAQHTGGLGTPRHVVSINTDPSCPMTAMANLGLVTDAGALLVELARRLEIDETIDHTPTTTITSTAGSASGGDRG